MSPPIRDGSGSSIGSIRLGDGSEIAEVRTGAGDVLFSAIPALPDNGLQHDYNAPAQTLGGSTVVDQAGTNDLTGVYQSGSINGVDAFDFGGTDDVTGNPASHGGSYTIHFVYLPDSVQNTTVIETGDGDGVEYQGNSDDRLVTHSGQASFTDGSYAASAEIISIRYGNTFTSTPDFAVNGTDVSLSGTGGLNFPTGRMILGGGGGGSFDGAVGRLLIYNQEQSNTEFNDTIDALGDQFAITT